METLIIAGYYILLLFLIVSLVSIFEFVFSTITRNVIIASLKIAYAVNSLFLAFSSFRLKINSTGKLGYRNLTTLIIIGSLLTYVKKYVSF